jgi:hypothetical protein
MDGFCCLVHVFCRIKCVQVEVQSRGLCTLTFHCCYHTGLHAVVLMVFPSSVRSELESPRWAQDSCAGDGSGERAGQQGGEKASPGQSLTDPCSSH